jgi:hypothetical protein
MSELETMIDGANQQVHQHNEAMLRQRINTLLSPQAQRVLETTLRPSDGVLLIGCLGVPCWLQLSPDGSRLWQFGCPWWRTLITEDPLFEARVLTEVGKVKLHIDGMLEKLDPKKMN